MVDIVERLKWWGAKRRPPRNMPTLPADCAEGSKAIAALRTELAVKETEALGYLRAVGTLQERLAETRAAALEEAAKVADAAKDMRERLFQENSASINASKAVQAEEIAAAIRALIPEREG